ncbi:MAG: TIGR01459 family HAD-type hydrolase [Burkholderiales bacterium]|nr:TIGR01459 family HAD-type hydrolase [Burkholderiales bacterium]
MDASPDRAAGAGAVALAGVAGLAPLFDGFIVDQWGVLHDGSHPYPGAVECLERLRQAGKHVVVLSNSGRREAANVRLMEQMGFPPRLFDRLVSAGEDAREAIVARTSPFHARLGRRCFAFTRSGDRSILEGIGVDFVSAVGEADFLAAIGIDSPRRNLADYEAELRGGIARGLPMICANPDIARFHEGRLVEATGVLARRYEELGGEVFYHGKPWPAIYASCLAALPDCAPGRVVAVGDSIEHDVLGARRAGLPSAFVAGGIHAGELGVAHGGEPSASAWREFERQAIAKPDYRLPAFVW